MLKITPIGRRELINKLRKLNFDGPFSATRHEYMIKGNHRVFIPNPHGGKDIGVPIIKAIIKQLDIDRNLFLDL